MIVDELNRKGITISHESENLMIAEVKDAYGAGEIVSLGSAHTGALIVATNSVNEFVRATVKHFPFAKQEKASDRPKNEYDGKFYAFNTFDEAVEVYLHKPHTVRTFDDKDSKVHVESSVGNDVSFDVTGDFLDIGRFLEGIPDVFGNMVMGNPRDLFVNITINLSCAAYVEAEAINHRAKRIMRLVDWLEAQRIRTQITGVETTQCGVNIIRIKHSHDPIDMDALASVVHSDFLRRIRFRVTEWSKTFQWGYGTATKLGEKAELDGGTLNLQFDWYESVGRVNEAFDKIEKRVEEILVENGAIIEQ